MHSRSLSQRAAVFNRYKIMNEKVNVSARASQRMQLKCK